MAKKHVKGIIIVGVTQTGKKSTSSTPFEFPEEDKQDGVDLLGLNKKYAPSCPNGIFIAVSAKNGSVQVAVLSVCLHVCVCHKSTV